MQELYTFGDTNDPNQFYVRVILENNLLSIHRHDNIEGGGWTNLSFLENNELDHVIAKLIARTIYELVTKNKPKSEIIRMFFNTYPDMQENDIKYIESGKIIDFHVNMAFIK